MIPLLKYFNIHENTSIPLKVSGAMKGKEQKSLEFRALNTQVWPQSSTNHMSAIHKEQFLNC